MLPYPLHLIDRSYFAQFSHRSKEKRNKPIFILIFFSIVFMYNFVNFKETQPMQFCRFRNNSNNHSHHQRHSAARQHHPISTFSFFSLKEIAGACLPSFICMFFLYCSCAPVPQVSKWIFCLLTWIDTSKKTCKCTWYLFSWIYIFLYLKKKFGEMGGGDGDGGGVCVCNVHGALGSIIIMREVHWSMHKKHKERRKWEFCVFCLLRRRRDECMEWIFGGEAVKKRWWRWWCGEVMGTMILVKWCNALGNVTRKDEDG